MKCAAAKWFCEVGGKREKVGLSTLYCHLRASYFCRVEFDEQPLLLSSTCEFA